MKAISCSLKYFIIINIFILLSACTDGGVVSSTSDYSKLCDIYKKVISENQPPAETSARLSEKIKKELPHIYPHFRRILMSDANKNGYALYKQLAKDDGEPNWECKEMKEYLAAVE